MKSFFTLLFAYIATQASFSQNVGIGTAAPSAKLHVTDTTGNILQLTNTKALSTGSSKMIFQTGGYYTAIIGAYGTGAATARLGFSTYASGTTNGLVERLSITDIGNVGIGTITPEFRLDINGNTHAGDNLYVDGNVGIGTLSPAAKLDINGSLKVSGKVTTPGTAGAHMLPIAFGKVRYDGYLSGGTGNFTVTRNLGGGEYYISIPSENYLWINRDLYVVVVSANDDDYHFVSSSIVNNNTIKVRSMIKTENASFNSDCSFSFVVYRLF